jgi:hypothetical protein
VLEHEGAILVGTLTMHELGMGEFIARHSEELANTDQILRTTTPIGGHR